MNAIIKDNQDRAADRRAIFEKLGLTMDAVFVPFSQSRNAHEKQSSLNWRVTLKVGRQSFTTDYMQGVGHLPNYSHQHSRLVAYDDAVRKACETGKSSLIKHKSAYDAAQAGRAHVSTPLTPPTREAVMYSLIMDASAIDYPIYEDWAAGMGYESDSRKGEAIYRQCLEIGLQLRAMLGDNNMEKLREAYQDY